MQLSEQIFLQTCSQELHIVTSDYWLYCSYLQYDARAHEFDGADCLIYFLEYSSVSQFLAYEHAQNLQFDFLQESCTPVIWPANEQDFPLPLFVNHVQFFKDEQFYHYLS